MFQKTMSVVRSQSKDREWKKVRYLVFDAPSHPGGFEERLAFVRQAVKDAPYAKAVRHYRCKGPGHMHHELTTIEARGGEGLMLREAGSEYVGTRSRTLLKVKTFHDAEAVITGYYPGKGKHKGVIGGFHVKTLAGTGVKPGVEFKIGTGLSDAERKHPPKIGTTITFRYQELSDSGTPRFASFLRVRKNPDLRLRELERRAATGDSRAARELEAARGRLATHRTELEDYVDRGAAGWNPAAYVSAVGDYGTIPYSELAMHTRAGGAKVVQYALWTGAWAPGRATSAAVLFLASPPHPAPQSYAVLKGTVGEVLPNEVRHELGGLGQERIPGHRTPKERVL
jgi:hypothetical protein